MKNFEIYDDETLGNFEKQKQNSIIFMTLQTKLSLEEAKLVKKYNSWVKINECI